MHSSLVGGGFFGVDGRVDTMKHVISLGDSHVEREAVRALCKGVPSTRTKTIKFSERPTCEQLRRQIELVNQCFGYITGHAGDLDLQLTVTMANDASPTPAAVPSPSVSTTAAASAPDSKSAPMQTDSTTTSAPMVHDALSDTEAKDVSTVPSHVSTAVAAAAVSSKLIQQESLSSSSLAVVA